MPYAHGLEAYPQVWDTAGFAILPGCKEAGATGDGGGDV